MRSTWGKQRDAANEFERELRSTWVWLRKRDVEGRAGLIAYYSAKCSRRKGGSEIPLYLCLLYYFKSFKSQPIPNHFLHNSHPPAHTRTPNFRRVFCSISQPHPAPSLPPTLPIPIQRQNPYHSHFHFHLPPPRPPSLSPLFFPLSPSAT